MDKQDQIKINRCIEQIKRGEGRAPIEDLYALVGNAIRFASVAFFGDTPEAEDVTQDFWLDIEAICAKCTIVVNGYGYLRKVFDNRCRMRLRSLSRYPTPLSIEALDAFEGGANPECSLRQQGLRESFARAQKEMDELERKVFALVCYGEASVREVAQKLGMSKSQVARVRQSMVDKLKKVLVEDGWDKTDE